MEMTDTVLLAGHSKNRTAIDEELDDIIFPWEENGLVWGSNEAMDEDWLDNHFGRPSGLMY